MHDNANLQDDQDQHDAEVRAAGVAPSELAKRAFAALDAKTAQN